MSGLRRRAVIIGAGPAGLTAALELLRRTDVVPIVLEASDSIGGISRTIRYKGNRMDIGGHRFFSKSDRVMQWWMDLMPPEDAAEVTYRGRTTSVGGRSQAATPGEDAIAGNGRGKGTARGEAEPMGGALRPPNDASAGRFVRFGDARLTSEVEGAVVLTATIEEDVSGDVEQEAHTVSAAPAACADDDLIMLIRPRKSRIYYLRRFFDYPIRLTIGTLRALGAVRTIRVGASYLWSRVHQIKPERSLEDFLINRFGRELYLTFFKSYTEKVWGTPCDRISAEWGAQRIKGLSLTTAVKHFVQRAIRRGPSAPTASADVAQKGTDTSLIERFLYPKLGPGQLWEHVADLVRAMGGEIHMQQTVDAICCVGERVAAIEARGASGSRERYEGDFFFSTMPVKELVRALDAAVPENVREVSEGLEYRDFITVGLLADRLRVQEADGSLLRDTWIYVQEPDVKLGRLQIFNNWSPFLVADPDKVWIGLEYFCYETDALWQMSDEAITQFAIAEIERIGILDAGAVRDSHVVRVPKTYPAYFGTYGRFEELRTYTDRFENLFLIGRNGMHKYNNQDHSMLTAMTAVDGIAAGHVSKAALWSINTEQEYHEEKRP